jgi:hypothetical protein
MSRAPYGGRHQSTRRVLLADAYGRPCCLCNELMLPGAGSRPGPRAGWVGLSRHGTRPM